MKASIPAIKQGLAGFLDGEFIPKYKKTHSAAVSYGVAVVAALAIDNLGNIMGQLADHPFVSYLGIVDANHDVDITKLMEFMRKQMPKEGLKVPVPMVGTLSFDKSDVDALEKYMKMQIPKDNDECDVEEECP